jgi:hypothetical protein
MHTHNVPQVNRSVIIASLHDALLCRKVGEKRLSQFFNDDAYSQYFIISNEQRKGLAEIQSDIANYINFLKNPNEYNVKEKMSISANPMPSVAPISHELSLEDAQWTKVFNKISEDARTLTIRKKILPKVAGYIKRESPCDVKEFKNAVRNIAAAFVKNKMEGLLVPSVMRQIEDVSHYMFSHDCNIFSAVRNTLDDVIITPAGVNELVIAMYKAYMKVHFKFLNRLGKRYHPFYYILIKSYMITIGNPSKTYSDSLFKIIKVILEIRLNDVDLLKAVA